MGELVLNILVRFMLPFTLILASLSRPIALSMVYLLFFFATPWLLQNKSPSQYTHLRRSLIFIIISSALFAVIHLLLNCVNILYPFLDSFEGKNVIPHIGFVNFKKMEAFAIVHWVLPDLMVTITAVIVLVVVIVSDKKERKSILSEKSEIDDNPNANLKYADMNRLLIIAYIRTVLKTSPIFSLIVLYITAVLRPSLLGMLYFLLFIVVGTYWALYRQIHCGIHYPLTAIVIALTLQITCFVSYQMSIVQSLLHSDSMWARIMGFEPLLQLNTHNLVFELNPKIGVNAYLSPIAMMWAYFVITLTILHHGRFKSIFTSMRMKIDPKHTKTPPESVNSIPEYPVAANLEAPSALEQFFYMIIDITSFIYKNSYILLNIIMMIWSIIYHSWLTFVLLIWANILWMIPNQRRSMMRSSFFVVMYAEFLIITQYIYGMNLNESELPTKVYGINLEQVGFHHPQNRGVQPYIPLTVQTIFLFIFWITSHQYFKEKAEDKESDLLFHIFGPRYSRSAHSLFEKSRAPRAIMFIFESISNFITRIWMWMLIFLIFLCAMVDQAMTGFRICYMSLFLLFLMVFQMSLQLWIRFLYGYWIFVIFYAMTILTIIYTYQFDSFDVYWHTFLYIQPTLQNDIGLRRYETKDLFLHLLIPTLTVIFTVVQIHYFHRRFMQSVRQPKPTNRTQSRMNPSIFGNTLRSVSQPRSFWKSFFNASNRKIRSKFRRWFQPSKLVVWRFLEMHMIKAVIFTTFTCAISEISCFNVILVTLSLASVCVNRFCRRVIFRIVTFWVSILILMKMIFQIKYLDAEHYNYICENNTVNLAEWMGLHKTDQMWGSLLRYISPYIIYMIITTMHGVVKLRDHLIRYSIGELKDRKTLFPHTARKDAERNFPSLLKYLLNFGYFKFGIEITLIALVSTIVHRRDVLAVTYAFWLIILLCMNRVQCARVWYMFQLYFVLSIFVQYLYLIHFPPNLCNDEGTEHFKDNQTLQALINHYIRSKLMLDFIVLLLIARQRKAFKAEMRQLNNLLYQGGDNRDIVHNIAKLGHVYFKNPTHDFCSFVRNYSDVFKTIIFCSFLWITLAIVFLGGVCSMDMLSLGYLLFALVFMLQGSEVYLQNIYYIICRWNILIAFNVFNIVMKACIIVFGNVLEIKDKQDYQSLFAVMQYNQSITPPEINEQTDADERYNYGPNSLIFENTLVWHAIIFAFVIFQSRIFRSYYFCHIIMDTQANTVLASRGAAVIENLHYKQIYDRRECESNVLENVKAKMELIKANNIKSYKKVRGRSRYTATSDDRGSQDMSTATSQIRSIRMKMHSIYSPLPKKRDLRLHPHAVRTGDYYMFEEPDVDEPLLYEEYDFLENEDMLTRQMIAASKAKRARDGNRNADNTDEYYSSDDEIDFETHPLVKLTSELIILVTFRLYRLSRNYRFVHKVLSAEKKTLQDISTMNRLGLVNTAAMFSFLNQSLFNKQVDPSNQARDSNPATVSKSEDFTTLDHNNFVQMLISLYYALIANSEVICYLAVFVNQAANSSVISLPLPFLVLYWGALTLPRPTKTFWVTLISYTLAMIFLKCIIHQKIVLDKKLTKVAQTTDFELFVKHGTAVYDLLLLVVLFWHRYMLKKQGIWNIPRLPTDPIPLSYNKPFSKDRPADILKRLREESGADRREQTIREMEFERDVDDLLRPGLENKYVYQNIESEYYRLAMERLEKDGGLCNRIQKFFLALLHKARLSTDVYTLLFLCDFVNFFVLLFGFPKFVYRHKYSASVLETYIQGNKVPFSFLFMLVVQFATIVAERAIYLRKALVVKIVFHFGTVIGVHIWMFFLVPYVTAHSFGATAPTIFYLIKCLHMLLSAYQMRCGYPRRILGNIFTKRYSMVNYVAFKVYMEIPFLYILRTMLDWLCIDTTLTVMEWIKMEDIFQSVFIVRCYRQMDSDFPVMRGEPKAFYAKFLIGGTIILILIALIWSPLFLFALVGTVGKPNVPNRADISVKIGHYEPIYVSQSYSGIHQFTKDEYASLHKSFDYDIYATDHITIYDAVDITAVKFDANSITLWNMSPPDKIRLLNDLKSGRTLDIRILLSFNCGSMSTKVSYETTYTLTKNKELTREMFIRALSDDKNTEKVVVPDILPKFITIQKMQVYFKFIKDFDGQYKRPIILQKNQGDGKVWWNVHDYCDDKFYKNILSSLPSSDCDGGIVMYIFNDKSFPSTMSFFEKTGIIGLYTTCVYVVSRVIRSLIANNHRRIMFEDLPFVDRILKLCNDIYLVRETKEYRLEEDLYAKLIFLYRSPETLIKWTRYKEDFVDDDQDIRSEISLDNMPPAPGDDRNEPPPGQPPAQPPPPP